MSRAETVDGPTETLATDYRRVSLLSLGHFTNDIYGSLLTSLTPYLVIRGVISTAVAGLVVLVYLIGSSVLQPVFGATSDRTGRRLFVVLGPLWIGVAASLAGWATNAAAILTLAAIGGIGTAAFHPQAASMVDRLSTRNKGWVMSIFSTGGNIGFASGPLLAAGISVIGLHMSPLALIPGVAVTLLLTLYAPRLQSSRGTVELVSLRTVGARTWKPLSAVVSVIAIRSSVQYGLIVFLPLYYHAHGSSAQLGSYYAFVLSLAGASGGLIGGRVSDLYGRRRVVVGSLILAVPALYAALLVHGPAVWLLLAVAGAALLASNSVTVVQGQELLPANTGMASGLTMGFGFGLSGILTFALGYLAEGIGVEQVVFLLPALAPVAAAMAWRVGDTSGQARETGHAQRSA